MNSQSSREVGRQRMSKATERARTEAQSKMQKVQSLRTPPRISDAEKELLKSVFGLESPIYTAIRDCCFGFELDNNQKAELKRLAPVMHLIRRIFLPEIKKEIAFGQTYDLWQTQDLQNATPQSFPYFRDAKLKMLEMIKASLDRMEDPEKKGVVLETGEDYSSLLARNGYLSYIDNQVRFLIDYALQGYLSEQEMKQILLMNSNK